MPNLFSRALPFLALGIMLVLLFAGLVLLSYLLVFGALVGIALFVMAWLKEKIFPPTQKPEQLKQGRIIEHDDNGPQN